MSQIGEQLVPPAQETVAIAGPEPAVASPPDAEQKGKEEQDREPSGTAAWLQSFSMTLVIALFVITFVAQAFQIPSESMEDTLLVGDYLLVDKVHYGPGGASMPLLPYRPIARGDIIVFRFPVRPTMHFVKRVIGVPGDRVRLRDGRVWVNDRLTIEPYVVHRSRVADFYRDNFPAYQTPPDHVESRWWREMAIDVHDGELVVPPGRYFALGDNRDSSLDSRYWGLVPQENIIGRPLLIYWSMDPVAAAGGPQDGTLGRFVYALLHVTQLTRWDRTLRPIP